VITLVLLVLEQALTNAYLADLTKYYKMAFVSVNQVLISFPTNQMYVKSVLRVV
jgi:hypothetical protein